MKEFVVKDYHTDLIDYCNTEIVTLNTRVHNYIIDIYNIKRTIVKDHPEFIRKYEIDINSIITNKVKGSSLLLTYNNSEDLFISRYNHLLTIINKINKDVAKSNKFVLVRNMPLAVLKIVLYACNFEHTKYMLKGLRVRLPKIGELYIARVPYDSSLPDWGASNRFKDFLKENGAAPKDKDNPNGKLWLVDNGLNRDDFCLVRWSKLNSKLLNKTQYRFNASVFGNFYPKSLKRTYTINEILNRTDTGLFDKLIHIYRFHYQYTQDNYPFINYTKERKKYGS